MKNGNGPPQEYQSLGNSSYQKIPLPLHHLGDRSRNLDPSTREWLSAEKQATQKPTKHWLDPVIV